jgi:sulfatase modifying factor 1
VGSFRPNGLGLYDMTGNVWEWCGEWCGDWFDENYYKNSSRDNPRGPGNGQQRVLRGGDWGSDPWTVRAAYRHWIDPAFRNHSLGFRLGASAR